jgi:pyruvate,water dikinase
MLNINGDSPMQNLKNIVWLDETDRGDLSSVGDKGASLMKLFKMGLNIPSGFCITTNAFKTLFCDVLSETILRTRDANLDRISELEKISQLAQRVVMNASISDCLALTICEAYSKLAGDAGEHMPVAVRSSVIAADVSAASFSGQHGSFSNVSGNNDLIWHIKKCWASLWSARAISYRHNRGFDHAQVFSAVIVQRMIPSEISGLLLTEHPFNKDGNHLLIKTGCDLGQAADPGKESVAEYVVAKDTGDIVSKRIEEISPNGVAVNRGSKAQEVQVSAGNTRSLPDSIIRDLAEIGKEIEQSFSSSQEVEWAIAGNNIYILQTRPVTSLNKRIMEIIAKEKQKLANCSPASVWSDKMVSETMTYPKPLSTEFIRKFMSKDGTIGIFYEKELDFGRPYSDPVISFICGRPYLNRNELIKPFSFMGFPLKPFAYEKVRKDPSRANALFPLVDAGFCGLKLIFYFLKVAVVFPYTLHKLFTRLYRLKKMMDTYYEEFSNKILPAYLAYIDDLKRKDPADFNEDELVSRIRSLFDHLARVSTMGHVKSEFASDIAYYILKAIVGEKANNLTCGIDGDKHLETNIELWKTVQQASPQVTDIFLTEPLENLQDQLNKIESGKDFLKKLDIFLDRYGHRAHNEIELADPRWKEDPEYLFGIIRTYVKAKRANPVEHFLRMKKIRKADEKIIREKLTSGFINKLVPVKYAIYRFALKSVHRYSPLRESTKFYYLMEIEQLRRYLLELGSRLASDRYNCLNNKSDIFFLFSEELQAIVEKKRSSKQTKRLIMERKMDYLLKKRIPVPSVIFHDGLESIGQESEHKAADVLSGTGVTKGKVTGTARIIKTPLQIGNLNHGDIMVAPTTDPGWTPLFFIVNALVMDTGNALSHGAVLAREYGLAAVVNVPGATEFIKDGQQITVDVEQGKVFLH